MTTTTKSYVKCVWADESHCTDNEDSPKPFYVVRHYGPFATWRDACEYLKDSEERGCSGYHQVVHTIPSPYTAISIVGRSTSTSLPN